MTFTKLEKEVFNLMAKEMASGGLLDVSEIAEKLNMTKNSVKGVVGSLVKKNKVEIDDCDMDLPPCIWPIHPKYGVGFWADSWKSEEELKDALL